MEEIVRGVAARIPVGPAGRSDTEHMIGRGQMVIAEFRRRLGEATGRVRDATGADNRSVLL